MEHNELNVKQCHVLVVKSQSTQ